MTSSRVIVHPTGLPVEVALEGERRRARVREAGQLGLDV